MMELRTLYRYSLILGLLCMIFWVQGCTNSSRPEDYDGEVKKDLLLGKWNLRKIDDHGNMDLILEAYDESQREEMRDRILLGREKACTRNSFEFKSDNSVSMVAAESGDAYWRWHATAPNRLIMEVPNMEEAGVAPPQLIVRRLDEQKFVYSSEKTSPSGKVYSITHVFEPAD